MKLGISVSLSLALLLVTSWIFSAATSLLNQPSTVAVIFGVVILLALLAGYIALGTSIVNAIRKKVAQSKEENVSKNRGPFTTAILIAALAAGITNTGCASRIGIGHVGIVASMAGDNRGVHEIALTTGWVFYNPAATQVFEYPTFNQTAVWTRNPNEGKHGENEEITFSTKDSMAVSVDVSLSYQLDATKVPSFYVKFRSDDLSTFTHGFLHNVARDKFNEIAGKYSVEQIMGDNGPFLKEVRKQLQDEVEPFGVQITQFGLIGVPRPPQGVIDSINAKVQAGQIALQKQNEILQSEADAKKKIAAAQGEAEANRILEASVTPRLIVWRQLAITETAINRWNGQRPMVEGSGGSGFLLNIPLPQQGAYPAAPANTAANTGEAAAEHLAKLKK